MQTIEQTRSATLTPEELSNFDMPIREVSEEQMEATRVARYANLKFPADRYPDSKLKGHERKNILIIGTGLVVEGGKDPMSAIPVNEGYTMSFVLAKPGNGPILHNHDTLESFTAIHGTWRIIWGLNQENSVDLNPLDVCACPPFVPRRFINLTPGEGREEGLLITVQAGDHPKAEWVHKDDDGNFFGKSVRG